MEIQQNGITTFIKINGSWSRIINFRVNSYFKEGMISLKDLSLTNQKNYKEFKKLIKYLRSISDTKIGIQISHSGRKGSSKLPWVKSNSPLTTNKWITIAPSKIKRDKKWPSPKEASMKEMNEIKDDFINTTKLAKRVGFDCLELHMAHGYLLHQFFSPISNRRKDEYGGNLKKRCKFLLEISSKIRKVWPKNKILGARVNGLDWVKNGSSISDCIFLCKNLELIGFDYVFITSGGIIPKTKIKFKKGYQVFLAKKIKEKTNIIVKTTGKISNLVHAEKLLKKNMLT